MTSHDHRAAAASAQPELENRLRALPKAPGPDPRFRDELRVQLLAAAERTPELSHSDEHTAAAIRSAAARRFRLPRGSAVRLPRSFAFRLPTPGRRAFAILGAAVAVLLVISGTTYWQAQRALPGDALYGLKRVGESVDLSTKNGDQSRGNAYLAISTTRIDEAAALVERSTSAGVAGPSHVPTGYPASGPLSSRVDGLVRGVLVAGDSAAVTATRLLTEASVAKRASHPAATVDGWLADQRSKVKSLVVRLPETGANTAGGAARMLERDLQTIQVRIKAVTAGLGCRQCRFSTSDRFGPLPCLVCPQPAHPSTPRRTSGPIPKRSPSASTLPPLATTALPSVLPTGTSPSSPLGVPTTTVTGPTSTSAPPPTTTVPPTDTSPPPPPTTSTTDAPTAPPTTTEPSDGSSAVPAAGSSDDPADPTQVPGS